MMSASNQVPLPPPAADLRETSRAFWGYFALIIDDAGGPLWTQQISDKCRIRVAVSQERKQLSYARPGSKSNSKAELVAGNEMVWRA
jgi:hypothetical protein